MTIADSIALKILSFVTIVFSPLGHTTPQDALWEPTPGWYQAADTYRFSAESQTLPAACRAHPEKFIQFPVSYYSAQEVWADGHLLAFYNSADLPRTETIFSSMSLSCRQITGFRSIQFMVHAPSKFFARVSHLPYLTAARPLQGNLSQMTYTLAFAVALFLSFFTWIVFRKKIETMYFYSLVTSCLATSAFCFFCCPGFWGLHLTLVDTHKLVLLCLTGTAWTIAGSLHRIQLLSGTTKTVATATSILALIGIYLAPDMDHAQMVINFSYLTYFAFYFEATVRSLKNLRRKPDMSSILMSAGIGFATATMLNDCLILLGAIDWVMICPLGLITLFFIQGFHVHRSIQRVFSQRDSFQVDLEKAYQEKLDLILKNSVAHSIRNTVQKIAHDLKHPFSMMTLSLEYLQSETQSADTVRMIKTNLRRSIGYANDLLQNLLMSGSEHPNRLEPLDLNELITSVWDRLSSAQLQAQLTLRLEHEGLVFADSSKVVRLFSNLLGNAIAALPEDSPQPIWIASTSVVENGRNFAQIVVGNSGSLIQKEQLETLFHPRVDRERTAGRGLGLVICQEIVHSHGGLISCRSNSEIGTEFIFTLPTVPST